MLTKWSQRNTYCWRNIVLGMLWLLTLYRNWETCKKKWQCRFGSEYVVIPHPAFPNHWYRFHLLPKFCRMSGLFIKLWRAMKILLSNLALPVCYHILGFLKNNLAEGYILLTYGSGNISWGSGTRESGINKFHDSLECMVVVVAYGILLSLNHTQTWKEVPLSGVMPF